MSIGSGNGMSIGCGIGIGFGIGIGMSFGSIYIYGKCLRISCYPYVHAFP